ncbi:MAG: FHA domain-containing protein [Bdellovibrionota bacterium]
MSEIFLKDRRGNNYAIKQDVLKLGRAIDNDIVLTDLSISRYHIALQPSNDGLLISNTGSDLGFYINNDFYMDTALAHSGDIIRIGREEFQVDIPTPMKSNDFGFTTHADDISRTNSLDINSARTKKIRIGVGLILVLMIGLALMPDPEENKASRNPTSTRPTEGLPTDSYTDMDVPRLGPQELTAEDLYKRGLRELSNGNNIRAVQYLQQSLVEDPSLVKADRTLEDTRVALKKQTETLIENSEKNYKDSRLALSRSQANQALNLLSEQIPGFSFQVQQKQRTLATQRLPVLSREQLYLDMACDQTPEVKLCERAVEILKRSRLKLGEENVLK